MQNEKESFKWRKYRLLDWKRILYFRQTKEGNRINTKRKIALLKTCKYINCENNVFGGSMCRNHQFARMDGKKPKPLARTAIKKKVVDRKPLNQPLEDFFYDCACAIHLHPYCMECGSYISKDYYRHATAHIFAKSVFEEIATNPLNWLKLGVNCGCHDKTHRMDTFAKMKVFPLAVQRFKEFEHLITTKHKFLDLFKSYIPCPQNQ